ncbi:hypothetical protein [Microcoleus sp. herbarium14]|uniref:hypothetical protein n=1 Tax=Microcoleus sp. herbarium14 TaxID=3055439 RepID=UPI002FD6B2EA
MSLRTVLDVLLNRRESILRRLKRRAGGFYCNLPQLLVAKAFLTGGTLLFETLTPASGRGFFRVLTPLYPEIQILGPSPATKNDVLLSLPCSKLREP